MARERIGDFEYLVAAAPDPAAARLDAIITVPLTSRQQDIDTQIDALDRRVLLAALIFILAGAGLGYSMAERIADPVNRLTRATRRIARGDFDARVASTSSDELAGWSPTSIRWRRAAAAAPAAGTHAPTRSVGRDGAPGGARDQEPAHAHPAQRRAPAARARRPRRAARPDPEGVRRDHPGAGGAPSADRLRVLQLRLVALRVAERRSKSPTS